LSAATPTSIEHFTASTLGEIGNGAQRALRALRGDKVMK
jgi:hypothetical protein